MCSTIESFAIYDILEYSRSGGCSLGYHKLGQITLNSIKSIKSWMTPTLTNYS